MIEVTSLQNPRIKQVMRLRERRERDETHLFLIEGYRELKRALDAKWNIDELFICPDFFLGENEGELIERSKAKIFSCAKHVFAKISYRDRPDGLLAIAPQRRLTLMDLQVLLQKKKHPPLLLLAESIEKPGNLGTMLRSADAAGADAVIACDPTTDIYNPNVVRSSTGILFSMPVITATGAETLSFLKEQGIAIVAATPSAGLEFTQADLKGPLAIAVGTEQYGLSDTWMSAADIQVCIPMCGVADSLNVASATTLLLYEALRQRQLAADR